MTVTRSAGILTIVCALVSGSVYAQAPASASDSQASLAERYVDTRNGLTLTDAIAHAIAHEPTLRVVRSEIDAARGGRLQAERRTNPTVAFERRIEPGGSDNQTTVQVEWPLDLSRRTPRVAVADREVQAAERSLDDRRRLVAGDVRQGYGEAAAAVRDVTVTDRVAASLRQTFELLRQRVEQGAAPPLDRDRLEVELRHAEAARLLAAGRADAAMYRLRRVIGADSDSPLMLSDTLETIAPPAIQEAIVQTSAASAATRDLGARRADVLEAEARVSVAESRIEQARSEGGIDLNLFGSYMRMDQGFPQFGFNGSGNLERIQGVFHYLSAGAMVTVPIGNRHQGDIAAAEAERAGATARLEATRLTAQAELASAAAQEVQTRRALALAQTSVQLAQQNLDVVRQTYELGRATVVDVLDEQRRYLDAERAYTDTLRAAYDARVALQLARGEM